MFAYRIIAKLIEIREGIAINPRIGNVCRVFSGSIGKIQIVLFEINYNGV